MRQKGNMALRPEKFLFVTISSYLWGILSFKQGRVMPDSLIHMIGKSDVFVENFKGIISYTCHEIIVKGYGIKFCVCGENLLIEHYCNDDMKISGQINEVRVIRET